MIHFFLPEIQGLPMVRGQRPGVASRARHAEGQVARVHLAQLPHRPPLRHHGVLPRGGEGNLFKCVKKPFDIFIQIAQPPQNLALVLLETDCVCVSNLTW